MMKNETNRRNLLVARFFLANALSGFVFDLMNDEEEGDEPVRRGRRKETTNE